VIESIEMDAARLATFVHSCQSYGSTKYLLTLSTFGIRR